MYSKEWKHLARQILLTSAGVSALISGGAVQGFTSILFAQIKNDHTMVFDAAEESWLASATTILLFPSSLISLFVMEKLGRRLTHIVADILAMIHWIMIYISTNYEMLLTARLLYGINIGILYPTIVTFVGEVSAPKYRTMFLSSFLVGLTIGTFVCQYIGEYLTWRTVAGIFIACSAYNIIVLICMKDSFVTSLDRNNIEEAEQLFEWYRGSTLEVKQEFGKIMIDKKKRNRDSFKEMLSMCMSKTFLIPLGITTLVYLTNEVTAIQAVVFYTSNIIDKIDHDPNFAFYATLALNIMRICAVILGMFLVKISTLRFVLISSGYCLGISLLCLALFMYLSETYVDNQVYPFLALCALILNTVLYSFGLGPLPTVVCAEMFPEATRSIGSSISVAVSFLFLFIVVKIMPMMLDSIGSYWTFCTFGICTLVGITASNLVLPNTKNKTLQEINKMYQQGVNS